MSLVFMVIYFCTISNPVVAQQDKHEWLKGHWGITFITMEGKKTTYTTTYRGVRSLFRMKIDPTRAGQLDNYILIWRWSGKSYRRLAELQVNKNDTVRLRWLDGACELETLQLMTVEQDHFELVTPGGSSNKGQWHRIVFKRQAY